MRRTRVIAHVVHMPQPLTVHIRDQIHSSAGVDQNQILQCCQILGDRKFCTVLFALPAVSKKYDRSIAAANRRSARIVSSQRKFKAASKRPTEIDTENLLR